MQFLLSTLLLAATAQAHYRFPRLILEGQPEAKDWTSIRETKNYQDNHPVTDVSSPDMRCFQARAGSGTATVSAGSNLGFVAAASISHFGPVQFYMARAPDAADLNTWEASGQVWFKVAKIDARPGKAGVLTSDTDTWPAYKTSAVNFTLPASLPSGNYLVRVESIALHQAANPGGAQIYLSCAQVQVTGGGSGTPGPMVAFPGAYKSGEPGLIWSYYPVKKTYTAPGPEVWTG